MKEAILFEKKENNFVKCKLCNHKCLIKEDNIGICGVRKNIKGELFSLVYGKTIAMNVDPIEKKPLFHFFPGSNSFSIGTVGCNFSCLFCQNYDISQVEKGKILGREISPEEIVDSAIENNCKSISYTYTEPTIFFEYVFDCAKIAKQKGLKNVFVSNGYMTKETFEMIKPYLDAINIDLKSFSEEFYKKICGAKLKPVLENIKRMKENGIWVEVTTLLIPGKNDSKKELESIANFLVNIDKNIPWHISRFHPLHKMVNIDITPLEKIHEAIKIGKKAGLNYVYSGNLQGDEFESTCCQKCDKKIIERFGYRIKTNLDKNKCGFCGEEIKIVID